MKLLLKILGLFLLTIIFSEELLAQKSELKCYLLERYFDDQTELYAMEYMSDGDTLIYKLQKLDTVRTLYSVKISQTNKLIYENKVYSYSNDLAAIYNIQSFFPCLINVLEFEVSDKSLLYTKILPGKQDYKEDVKVYFKKLQLPFDFRLYFYIGIGHREQYNVKAKVKLSHFENRLEKVNIRTSRVRIIGTMPIDGVLPKKYVENYEIYPVSRYRYNQMTRM